MRLICQALRLGGGFSRGVAWVAMLRQPLQQSAQARTLRAMGVRPVFGDLDKPQTLRRWAGVAHRVVHLAPPPSAGYEASKQASTAVRDTRTRHLARALSRGFKGGSQLQAVVYVSTSGVYGHCAGQWVSEERAPAPTTPRAQRRMDAERQIRKWGRKGVKGAILRAPGIYAPDRPAGTPRERLLKGTPVLNREHDGYVNHIHADDLARAAWLACWRGKFAGRVLNANDNTVWKMGDYFEWAAQLYGLPPPRRISWEEAQASLPESLLSFWRESRRLRNTRMLRELRMQLRYPTVEQGLCA